MTVLPTTIAAWEAETVRLTCAVDAYPRETRIGWFHDDVELQTNSNGTYASSSDGSFHHLNIASIKRCDV